MSGAIQTAWGLAKGAFDTGHQEARSQFRAFATDMGEKEGEIE